MCFRAHWTGADLPSPPCLPPPSTGLSFLQLLPQGPGWLGGASRMLGGQEQGQCPIASFSQAAAQLVTSGHTHARTRSL